MTLAQASIVDRTMFEEASGRVKLIVNETREVHDLSTWQNEFEQKVNTYLLYVCSGQLASNDPHLANSRVDVVILFDHRPPDGILPILRQAAQQLYVARIGLEVVWEDAAQGMRRIPIDGAP